jgi:hypothetical protein
VVEEVINTGRQDTSRRVKDRIIATSDNDIRSIMIEYFSEKESITPESRNNWQVVPETWKAKGMARDLKLLQ